MKKLCSSRLIAALFAVVFLAVLIFSALTPMIADDFSYCFSWVDSSRITSPLQIPASMAAHRAVTNGRVFAHSVVQLMLMAPKMLFNFLNAACAVLLLWLYGRHFREQETWKRILLLGSAVLLLWNEMPSFGQVVLWLDGSINYSWGISLFLLFLWPYTRMYWGQAHKGSLPRDLLFFLLAFVAGAYSENGSLCTLFIAFCLTGLTALREKKLRWRPLAGLALGGLGFLFLMSAPSTSGRSSSLDLTTVARNFKYIAGTAKEDMLPLFSIFAAALALCLLFKADRRKIGFAVVVFLGGLGSLASFVFALYFVPRHFCFTVYFTVLACLVLFSALLEKGKPVFPALTAAVMAVLFAFNFALGALDIGVIYLHARQREAQIALALADGRRDVELEVYESATKYSAPHQLDDLLVGQNYGSPNESMAQYYGLDSVTGLAPETESSPAD